MDRSVASLSSHTENSSPFRDLHRCLHIRTYSIQELLLEYCLVIVTLGFFILVSLFSKMVKCHFIMSVWSSGGYSDRCFVHVDCKLKMSGKWSFSTDMDLVRTALEREKKRETPLGSLISFLHHKTKLSYLYKIRPPLSHFLEDKEWTYFFLKNSRTVNVSIWSHLSQFI